MDRDVAIRIDGMLLNVLAALNGIAFYLKNNLVEEEFKELTRIVGRSMGELVDFSSRLHTIYPDITPKELTADNEQA